MNHSRKGHTRTTDSGCASDVLFSPLSLVFLCLLTVSLCYLISFFSLSLFLSSSLLVSFFRFLTLSSFLFPFLFCSSFPPSLFTPPHPHSSHKNSALLSSLRLPTFYAKANAKSHTTTLAKNLHRYGHYFFLIASIFLSYQSFFHHCVPSPTLHPKQARTCLASPLLHKLPQNILHPSQLSTTVFLFLFCQRTNIYLIRGRSRRLYSYAPCPWQLLIPSHLLCPLLAPSHLLYLSSD